jgi:uncharacterized membrane protein YfcA
MTSTENRFAPPTEVAAHSSRGIRRPAGARAWPASIRLGWLFGFGALIAVAWMGYQNWLGLPPTVEQYASLAIVLVAGFVSGVAGFAFSAIAAGGFAHLHVDPVQAVEIMALCSIAIQLYSVIAIRRHIRWPSVLPFVAGGLVTLPLGIYWLTHMSVPLFNLLLGVFLVAYGVKGLAKPVPHHWRGNWRIDVAVGALGGITGGVVAFPGAFVTIWCTLRGWDKDTSRGVYQPYILIMQLAAVLWMRAEAIPFVDAGTAVPCIAVALLAAHLGLAVFRRLGNQQFARIVAALLAVSGLSLLARVL